MARRAIRFDPACLVEIMKTGRTVLEVKEDPLPDDAEFVTLMCDEHGILCIVVDSAEFEDNPEGGEIPVVSHTLVVYKPEAS